MSQIGEPKKDERKTDESVVFHDAEETGAHSAVVDGVTTKFQDQIIELVKKQLADVVEKVVQSSAIPIGGDKKVQSPRVGFTEGVRLDATPSRHASSFSGKDDESSDEDDEVVDYSGVDFVDEERRVKRFQVYEPVLRQLMRLTKDNWIGWLSQVKRLRAQLGVHDVGAFYEAAVLFCGSRIVAEALQEKGGDKHYDVEVVKVVRRMYLSVREQEF